MIKMKRMVCQVSSSSSPAKELAPRVKCMPRIWDTDSVIPFCSSEYGIMQHNNH
ncbi:hypothetical protein JHK87_038007 [Glycine soja]|nr:hypothetical protein JHK87_038007 [Glycine soja]